MNERSLILSRALASTGTTQAQLSKLSGVAQPSISQMVTGKISVSDRLLQRLLNCMGQQLEVSRRSYRPQLTRPQWRSWKLHRRLAQSLTETQLREWRPQLLNNIERLSQGLRGQPHARNLERWRQLIENAELKELRAALTGLDDEALEMRELSPFSGLLSPEQRQRILDED